MSGLFSAFSYDIKFVVNAYIVLNFFVDFGLFKFSCTIMTPNFVYAYGSLFIIDVKHQ